MLTPTLCAKAYARADFWDERVRIMTWWAERCEEMRARRGCDFPASVNGMARSKRFENSSNRAAIKQPEKATELRRVTA